MRATVLAVLVCGAATATPIKPDSLAERAKLESLWADLQSTDPVVRLRAAFALADHPKATDFLGEKLPAVRASEKQIRDWLKDLNSDDGKVRNRAVEQLRYFDPRLVLGVKEQITLVETEKARRLLVLLLCGWSFGGNPDRQETLALRTNDGPDHENVLVVENKTTWRGNPKAIPTTDTFALTVTPVATLQSKAWDAAAAAVAVLDRIATPAADRILDRLAAGHPEALPTRAARMCFTHGPPDPLTAARFDRIWTGLGNGDHESVRNALALRDDRAAVGFLKAKLPPIQADKAQMTRWLKQLGGDDWKEAYESLLTFHPLLALTPREAIDGCETEEALARLGGVWDGMPVEVGDFNQWVGTTAKVEAGSVTWKYTFQKGVHHRYTQNMSLDRVMLPSWTRARVAVVLLEHIGTPDAKAVLKQLAEGHPDVLPTKDARAALARMK